MSERKFNTYMKRHLLKENVGGDVENEFQNWLDEMSLKFDDEKITLQTVIDYAQDTLQDYGMDDWQPGQPLPENKKSVKENIETLLSPEDLEYYRAHRDEIEDILHAEWRHSKLSAKDAVEKHKENKLQQAKRGGGKETSLRAIAALGKKPLKENDYPFKNEAGEVIDDVLYDTLSEDIDPDQLLNDMFDQAERTPDIKLVDFMMSYYNDED